MKDFVLYAPEDRHYLEQLVSHLPGVQAVEIGTALAMLTTMPVHRVLLLMSIDLLHRLVCEAKYRALYRRLKLFGYEGMVLIVYLRACHWQDSFGHCAVFPPEAITTLPEAVHAAIYQEIAAVLVTRF